MREIAEGLGLAPGALYYYFESKEDLLHACQEISLDLLTRRAREVARSDASPPEKVRALVRAHLEATLDELGGSAAHLEFRSLPPDRFRSVVSKRDAYEGWVRRILRDGVRRGAFRPLDVKLTALALLGALNWTVVWWRPEGRWTPGDLVDGFAETFLRGIRAEDGA
jgi:AcrR family transcriptional regulator